jgi:hypothetical protein
MNRNRSAILGLLVGAIAILAGLGATPCQADPFFDFYGFSYLDGPPNTVGTTVQVPMLLNTIQPDPIWPLDFSGHEYTVTVENAVISEVQAMGPMLSITYVGGTIAMRGDGAKNAQWAANPPNALVPATFDDGETLLSGTLTEFVEIWSPMAGTGTISATITWTGGSRLGDLVNPSNWTLFGGVSNNPDLGIPGGFDLAWDPQFYGPGITPVKSGSWGSIKANFR